MKGLDILGALSLNKALTITPRTPVKSTARPLALPVKSTVPTKSATAPQAVTVAPPSPQAVSKANASAGNLMSMAKRVASKHPKRALGKVAQTAASNSLARVKNAQAIAAHRVMGIGVDWGAVTKTALDPSAWLATQAGTDDAFYGMVEAGGRALDVIDKLTAAGFQSLADQGNAIVANMENLLSTANAQLDPSGAAYAGGAGTQYGSQAFALIQQENTWENGANVALSGGTAGAGGGSTSPSGGGTTTATGPNAPTIQSVVDAVTGVPNSGNPGDGVTITGTNFTGTTAVSFGGVPAAGFVVVSATQINATVPQTPGSGPVTVQTPSGVASSLQPFVLASSINYGDAGGFGGGGGGSYGGGGGGFGGGGGYDDGGGTVDDGSGDPSAQLDQGGDTEYVFDQATIDQSYGGYGTSVDQGDYDPGVYAPPVAPQAAPAPTPVTVSKWHSKDAYSTGDVVSYKGSYYRATKDVSSRWLFSNDAPDSSDAWESMTPKKVTATTDAPPDATLGFDSWDPWTLLYDPAGGLYRYMNQAPDPVYQPRAVNTYWQNRAQSPIAASAASRLQLAQQLQQNLQSQLAARYAALAAATTQPMLTGESGMSRKIIGPALCGFADYFDDDPVAVVGATSGLSRITRLVTHVPQKGALSHGVTVKRSPGGHPISSLHINPKVLHRRDPATVQHAMQLAAQHAQTVAHNVLAAADHVATVQKTHGKAPAVHGVGAGLRRPPTAQHVPEKSLTQLKRDAKDLQKAASKLLDAASKFKKQTDQAKSKQGAAISHQKSVTKIHGMIGVDASGLSPGMPGYDPTTDPTAGGGYGPTDPTGGALPPPSGVTQVPGPPDYGAGPTPTVDTVSPQPEIDYVPSSDLGPQDWAQFYTSDPSGVLPNGSLGSPVPLGAIYFDGSRPLPFRAVGNATCFYGMLPDGSMPKGGPNSGYEWHGSGGFDWALVLQGPGGGYNGGKNYDKVNNPDMGMISESQKNGWGPLVGNPQIPEMDGLRFDVAKLAFFWPYDKAPDWAQAPVKQAAFNAAIAAWKAAQTAGQADYVAAQLQDKLDAQTAQANARQQAQQDVQLAMQQQQFDAQQAQQQAALDMQSQQDAEAAAAAQAQLDAQQQAADIQAQQQMQQLQMQQMQLQMQQQAAQPVYVDQGGGYADQGGGDAGGGVDPSDPYGLADAGSPEDASDAEAAQLDSLVGAGSIDTLLRKRQLMEDGAVDGAGQVIDLDDFGNVND